MTPFKIFLVDDDAIFIFLTKKTIEATAIATEVKEFGDGLAVLEYLKQIIHDNELLPDLICLDINMPVMDGWEFLEEYQSLQTLIKKDIPLYLVSSSISPHDIERAKSFSVVSDFCVKPLGKEKVKELLLNINVK